MHLDHGNSFELAMQAMRAGYTSIMIDGSHYTFDENVELTKRVVSACHPNLIPVEAELGKVGGKEDDLDGGEGDPYTNPQEAARFVELTQVDSLAVAIGTAHGVYKGIPKLDFERLSEIRKVVEIPLVLHGTSGVPDDAVKECIRRGMCKVNYATDLRIAFTNGVNRVLNAAPGTIDPKKYNSEGRIEVESMFCKDGNPRLHRERLILKDGVNLYENNNFNRKPLYRQNYCDWSSGAWKSHRIEKQSSIFLARESMLRWRWLN